MKIKILRLSVVIPTFNCESKLPMCLASVKWADEILVVDMLSTDRTTEIAKKYKAVIFEKVPKDGNFDKNRQFGMGKATGDWILKIDSDEILSVTLQNKIKDLLKNDKFIYDGFNLYNRMFMFGHQIKHGFVKINSHELRLVRKGKWRYNPFRFHQQIIVDGPVGYLTGTYDHYNFDSVAEFVIKMNKYTDTDSRYFDHKVSFIGLLLAPFQTFCKLFFWQYGFLEGKIGLIVCFLFSIYNLVEKVKVYEYQKI